MEGEEDWGGGVGWGVAVGCGGGGEDGEEAAGGDRVVG